MKTIISISVILLVLLAYSFVFSASPGQIIAPEDTLEDILEKELQDGRWELVMFWATYCHICKKDFKKLDKFIKDNPDVPLTIVGVVVDGIEEEDETRTLVEKHNLDYTHLITDYDRANNVYHAKTDKKLIGTPSYLLYNLQNKLVAFNTNAIDIDALEIYVYE